MRTCTHGQIHSAPQAEQVFFLHATSTEQICTVKCTVHTVTSAPSRVSPPNSPTPHSGTRPLMPTEPPQQGARDALARRGGPGISSARAASSKRAPLALGPNCSRAERGPLSHARDDSTGVRRRALGETEATPGESGEQLRTCARSSRTAAALPCSHFCAAVCSEPCAATAGVE